MPALPAGSATRTGGGAPGHADLAWTGPRAAGSDALFISQNRGHCTWGRQGRALVVSSEDSSSSHLSGPPEFQLRAGADSWPWRVRAVQRSLLAGRRAVTAADPARRLVVHTADSRYDCKSALFPAASPSCLVFLARLPCSISSFSVRPLLSQAHRTDPVQDGLSVLSKGWMRPHLSPSFQLGPRQNKVLLSFPRRAPPTTGEVKDSWAPAYSQGRSRGLDSPSSSHQPWEVWSAEDSAAVPRCLPCPLGKPLIPQR